jgi:hypothetical protein
VSEATAVIPRPRVRAGAIAWGLMVIGIATTVLTVIGQPQSRGDFAEWIGSATPGGVAIVAVLAVGAFILLLAVLSLIRRAQRR